MSIKSRGLSAIAQLRKELSGTTLRQHLVAIDRYVGYLRGRMKQERDANDRTQATLATVTMAEREAATELAAARELLRTLRECLQQLEARCVKLTELNEEWAQDADRKHDPPPLANTTDRVKNYLRMMKSLRQRMSFMVPDAERSHRSGTIAFDLSQLKRMNARGERIQVLGMMALGLGEAGMATRFFSSDPIVDSLSEEDSRKVRHWIYEWLKKDTDLDVDNPRQELIKRVLHKPLF